MDNQHEQMLCLNDDELDFTTRGVYLIVEMAKESAQLRNSLDMKALQAFKRRLNDEGARRSELASMQFDDCAGGACKL